MSNRKLVIKAALAMAAGLGVATSSWAGTASQSLAVQTHVVESCVINSSTDVTFGNYDPLASSPLATNGSITMTCTKGSNGVTLGVGTGLHASSGQRRMVGTAVGTEFLNYDLFQPDSSGNLTTTAFDGSFTGTGAFAVGASNFASGSTAVTVKIFGSIPISQDVTGQSGIGNAFNDTVLATVTF